MHNFRENPKSAMGELETVENTPVIQISAQYGILNNVFQLVDNAASGTISSVDSKFVGETGTAANGTANISTRKQLYARAGQGAMIILDAMFDTPTLLTQQIAGFLNSEDGFAFGYIEDQYGIIYLSNGNDELLNLTIITAGTGTATVTIDGTGYPVVLTAGSEEHNAAEIALQLNGVIPNYIVTATEDEVVFLAQFPDPKGAFSFTGSTAVTIFDREITARSPDIEFIPQADWNGESVNWINPQLLNTYKIVFDGNITFYVMNQETSKFELVHTIKHTNSSDMPNVSNPTFRGGWFVRNIGNTTNIKIQGSKLGMFTQGKNVVPVFVRSISNSVDVNQTEVSILTLRNRFAFKNRINRSDIIPRTLSMSTESTRAMFFNIYVFPFFADEVIFNYIDKETSITEYSLDTSELIGFGQLIGTFTASAGAGAIIQLDDLNFQPDTVICITAVNTKNQIDSANVSVTWNEDL